MNKRYRKYQSYQLKWLLGHLSYELDNITKKDIENNQLFRDNIISIKEIFDEISLRLS